MRAKTKIILTLGMICLYLAIISLAITLTIWNRPLYQVIANVMNIPKHVGLSMAELMNNYDILMTYLNNPAIETLHMPDFQTSASGAFHFWEVRRLFFLNYAVMIVMLIISIVFIWWIAKNKYHIYLVKPFEYLLALPIVVMVLLALFFDQIFVLFHEIAFDNDAWIFNPATDSIIEALPEAYFFACFLSVFILIELMTFAGYLWSKRHIK